METLYKLKWLRHFWCPLNIDKDSGHSTGDSSLICAVRKGGKRSLHTTSSSDPERAPTSGHHERLKETGRENTTNGSWWNLQVLSTTTPLKTIHALANGS